MADGVSGPVRIARENFSDVQLERLSYVPPLPEVFANAASSTVVVAEATAAPSPALASWFPSTAAQNILSVVNTAAGAGAAAAGKALRIGVLFCGRQSPGGHNVVSGLYDYLQSAAPGSTLLGVVGGTLGLFAQKVMPITAELLADYRNQGGYHLLGRSVDRIRSAKEQEAAVAACSALGLDGLVLIGGTHTNSDAAHLAEAARARGCPTKVIGVPVSIDGDLAGPFVEANLGFDTATKVYAELVGNLETDCNSAKKYYYFVRLMGRQPSHIALEVALQTRPQYVVLGEDIEARKLTLTDIVRELADVVTARAAAGKNFGVVLVPEGAISYIPELRTLIGEMNQLFADGVAAAAVPARLTPWSAAVLSYLPAVVRQQLFIERESSGSVQLSQISTERMLAELVGEELARRKADKRYAGKYAPLCFFFGYQARCSLPSNFDCAYGQALGYTAGALVAGGHTGYLATIRDLAGPVATWQPTGVPLTSLVKTPAAGSALAVQTFDASSAAGGRAPAGARPVIESSHVDVFGPAFKLYEAKKATWAAQELYMNPGPIQFRGPCADDITMSLTASRHDYLRRLRSCRERVEKLRGLIVAGVSDSVLDAALSGITSLSDMLELLVRKDGL